MGPRRARPWSASKFAPVFANALWSRLTVYPEGNDGSMDPMDFPRIKRLPPYVFNIVGDLKQKARRAGEDIIDFGMGNPDGADAAARRRQADRGRLEADQPPLLGVEGHLQAAPGDRRLVQAPLRRRPRPRHAKPSPPSARRKASAHLALAILGPGDVVLCPSPTYPIHQYSVIIAGGDLRSIPLIPGEDFFAHLVEAMRQTWPQAEAADPQLPGTTRPPRSSTSTFFEQDRRLRARALADGHPRSGLRRSVLRRLRGAELPAGAGRQGRRRRVLHAVEELQHAGLARRLLRSATRR